MKLYYFDTLNPRKACTVARYLNSPVEFVHVNLGKGEHKSPQYLAVNPNGKVPALEDGDLKLWEANAIMCHLAGASDSDLWPKETERQVEVMRWLSWNSEHFTHHASALYFEYLIKPRFGLGTIDRAAVIEASGWVTKFGAVLDDHLNGPKFLLGDALTIADFAVAITLPYAKEAHIPLDGFPHIQRWHDRLNELPAWREPFPTTEAVAA
ncbi:MAG: glutathione S-transferase family protein [Pseudorhodoplanes sp.]|jgi:glutathione S-transferase|nr:glutathione S-transferase family protein [Pseudorhodoplanes sp.]